jgi:hypothetical protein
MAMFWHGTLSQASYLDCADTGLGKAQANGTVAGTTQPAGEGWGQHDFMAQLLLALGTGKALK